MIDRDEEMAREASLKISSESEWDYFGDADELQRLTVNHITVAIRQARREGALEMREAAAEYADLWLKEVHAATGLDIGKGIRNLSLEEPEAGK